MPNLPLRAKLLLVAAVLLVGLFKLVDWAAEYFWFEALDFAGVFWTMRALKVGFFLCAFVPALVYFWINFRILSARLDLGVVTKALATHLVARPGVRGVPPQSAADPQAAAQRPSRAGVRSLAVLAALAIALLFGLLFHGEWDTLLRFWWSRAYGAAEPIYGRDIGFYLFEVPLLELLQDSLLAATLLASALLVLGYYHAGILNIGWRRGVEAPTPVLWHVSANLALVLLALAWGFYLDRFALLQSTRGAVHGAGYTDLQAVLPAIWVMLGATLGLAAVLLVPRLLRKGMVVLITVNGYLAIFLIGMVILPWGVQSFVVEPNELELETPFLRHNIALTRQAYQLDRVDERSHPRLDALSAGALARNRETIDNIRVWDWRPLSETLRQLQQIRAYYAFGDVDVDRYRVGDDVRQVMLAVRELSDSLPGRAETWVNRRLQFTHGYGLAMSLTAEKDPQGGPVLLIKDLPPQSDAGLAVGQPAIYFGESMTGYRIVATAVPEFDYPKGDENIYSRYAGRGGIALDGFWKRVLFAWHQFDVNILVTAYITPESRIQLWRDVAERVGRIAPFLRLDQDPYPVLSEGRLVWVQDAYTVSDLFPYSEPYRRRFNYIRNSVKVVVDAYEGEVAFYVVDTDDPLLKAYRQAFPTLFRGLEQMPEDLRRHLRYPQDLFEVQIEKYSTYHMTVPQVFYNGEDLWQVPREKYGGEVIAMKPYYVLMKLPQETRLQFLLMLPLTPANRTNMIAWMAARCDFPDYGELVVYKLPKERLILGPIQVEAMIDQDTLISQQLSLWDQRGSRVVRGNLLVIPIEQSFLYVEPVYLIAEDSEIPQLKRVIVSDGERVAMEPTLEESLQAVFGAALPAVPAAPGAAEDARLAAAREALAEAEAALKVGDWDGFGRAMQALKRLLGE